MKSSINNLYSNSTIIVNSSICPEMTNIRSDIDLLHSLENKYIMIIIDAPSDDRFSGIAQYNIDDNALKDDIIQTAQIRKITSDATDMQGLNILHKDGHQQQHTNNNNSHHTYNHSQCPNNYCQYNHSHVETLPQRYQNVKNYYIISGFRHRHSMQNNDAMIHLGDNNMFNISANPFIVGSLGDDECTPILLSNTINKLQRVPFEHYFAAYYSQFIDTKMCQAEKKFVITPAHDIFHPLPNALFGGTDSLLLSSHINSRANDTTAIQLSGGVHETNCAQSMDAQPPSPSQSSLVQLYVHEIAVFDKQDEKEIAVTPSRKRGAFGSMISQSSAGHSIVSQQILGLTLYKNLTNHHLMFTILFRWFVLC